MVFSLFRKRFDKVVAQADKLFEAGQLGLARGEYADALNRFKAGQDSPEEKARVEQRLREVHVKLADAQIEGGNRFLGVGNFEDARGCFEAALALAEQAGDDGALDRAHDALDSLDHAREESTRAARAKREAMDIDRHTHEDTDAEFALLISTFPDAREDAYAELGPDFRDGYLALNVGQARKALKHFDKVNQPDAPWLAYERARALRVLGQTNEAVQAFEKAARLLEDDPAILPVLSNLVDTALRGGRFDVAEAAIDRHAQIEGEKLESEDVATMRVNMLRAKGDHAQALTYLRARMKQTPSALALWRLMGITCEEAGKDAEAIAAYEQVMGLRWRFVPERNVVDCDQFSASRLAELLLKTGGDAERALQLTAALMLQMGPEGRWQPLMLRAAVLRQAGRTPEAIRQVEEELERLSPQAPPEARQQLTAALAALKTKA